MTAFVDDALNGTNMENTTNHNIERLTQQITDNTQAWANYVHVTGQKLELAKCDCFIYIWTNDEDGNFSIFKVQKDSIQVIDPETNTTTIIPIRDMHQAYKHMGLQVTGDRNTTPEFITRKEKSDDYADGFAKSPISGIFANFAFRCSYSPKLRYGLPVTTFTKKECTTIQRRAIRTFLPKIGFNRNMPIEVIFPPSTLAASTYFTRTTFKAMVKLNWSCDTSETKPPPANASASISHVTSYALVWSNQH